MEALFRALDALPGNIRRFVSCDVGANHCRSRHIEWEKFGHGLTSSPRETASVAFLNELLVLFQYIPRSASAQLDGTLPLRYCAARFATKVPTWRWSPGGAVADLVTEGDEEVGIVHAVPGGIGAGWAQGSGEGERKGEFFNEFD